MMALLSPISSITDRDGYIEAQALLYAIATLQALPDEKQEWSDMMDMCALARRMPPNTAAMHAFFVWSHTGITPDLWPYDEDEHSPEEQAERASYLASYKAKLADLTLEASC